MKTLRHILLPATAALLACACSSVEEPEAPAATAAPQPAGAGQTCELVVRLTAETSVSNSGAASRADQPWGDPYPEEAGTPSESAIGSVDLFFITPFGDVMALAASRVSPTDGEYVYKTKVDLNSAYVGTGANGEHTLTGRIVAMANYPASGSPVNPFTAPAYDIAAIGEQGTIPMWGITTLTGVSLIKDGTVDVGGIKLLRSVPKVTLELDSEIKDLYRITAVKASADDYSPRAYCQPTGGSRAASTSSLLIEGCFNPAEGQGCAPGGFYTTAEGNKVWFYPAERRCTAGADGLPPYLTVTLERTDGTGAPFTGRVYLCDYSEAGAPMFDTAFPALVRNHDYQYVISLARLEFIISFREWVFGGKVHIELE